MDETDTHRLRHVMAGELQDCIQLFRPADARLGRLYDHVVQSDLLAMLIGPALRGHLGLTAGEWLSAWQDSADELVPEYVDFAYSWTELADVRTRVTHAMASVELDPDEREQRRDDLEEELRDGK